LGVQPEEEAVAQPTAANWHLAHPYPMQPNFTGRKVERAVLTAWLLAGKEPLLVLRARRLWQERAELVLAHPRHRPPHLAARRLLEFLRRGRQL
ncbi:MAG: hypothetical protein KDE58_28450, partial [Caldilineaceae bacterium]|nr:hypothetical protein [Caldilineaceae bacterium]